MSNNKNQNVMLRKEQAARNNVSRTVEYRIEDDDIIFTNDKYVGQKVSDLFYKGSLERDYVIRHLWFGGDNKVLEIINKLVCK